MKLLIGCAALLLLSSCAEQQPPETIVQTEYIERNIPIQQRPDPVEISPVTWDVVNQENLDEFLASVKNQNAGDLVFVAISVREYEILSLNLAELERYIRDQQQLIVYYENQSR